MRIEKTKSVLFIIIAVILILPSQPSRTADAEAETSVPKSRKTTLVISKVSPNPKKHYEYLKPMVEYAVKHMKDLGITEAKVLMARNDEQMIDFLNTGRVDWVTESIYSALLYEDKCDAEILLRKWKKGVPEYHTVFFTRKDSGIRTLSDLVGKKIVFEDPGSATAFYEAAYQLISRGLELVRLDSPRAQPVPGKVGYVFSKQEITSSMWVYKRLVHAGAFSDLDWNDPDHLYVHMKKDLRIFHTNRPIPRAFEIVRKDLSQAIKDRLRQILLNAHNDPKAKYVLRAYQKTKQFDELDDNSISVLDEIRQIRRSVERNIR